MYDDYIPRDRDLRTNLRLATIAISAQAELNRNLVDNLETKDKTTDFFEEKYLKLQQENSYLRQEKRELQQENNDLKQEKRELQQENNDLKQENLELQGKVKFLENKVRESECEPNAWDNDGSSNADCRDREYAAGRLESW